MKKRLNQRARAILLSHFALEASFLFTAAKPTSLPTQGTSSGSRRQLCPVDTGTDTGHPTPSTAKSVVCRREVLNNSQRGSNHVYLSSTTADSSSSRCSPGLSKAGVTRTRGIILCRARHAHGGKRWLTLLLATKRCYCSQLPQKHGNGRPQGEEGPFFCVDHGSDVLYDNVPPVSSRLCHLWK